MVENISDKMRLLNKERRSPSSFNTFTSRHDWCGTAIQKMPVLDSALKNSQFWSANNDASHSLQARVPYAFRYPTKAKLSWRIGLGFMGGTKQGMLNRQFVRR